MMKNILLFSLLLFAPLLSLTGCNSQNATIVITPNEHAKIECSISSLSGNSGDRGTLTITPDKDYYVNSVTQNDMFPLLKVEDNVYSFTLLSGENVFTVKLDYVETEESNSELIGQGNEVVITDGELTDEVTKLYVNGGTKEELEKKTGFDNIESLNIITGPDSYTRVTPSKSVTDKNNLDDYVSKAAELSKNLEKEIKDNLDYSILASNTTGNVKTYMVTLKSYFYYIYMFDLNNLQEIILTNSGLEYNEVNEYKAKVKAMEILDKHLDNYQNESDETTAIVTYTLNDSEATSQSLYDYLLILEGENYLYNCDTVTNLMENQNQRVQDYYNFGLSEGILDSNNLLGL